MLASKNCQSLQPRWTGRYPRAHAAFGFQTEPAGLDRFIENLRKIQRDRFGSASLALA
jgi:hypothetical protein